MEIDKDQIHLWQADQADFDLATLQATCLSWLTEAELRRYHRFLFDRHRRQLLLGRMLMRSALSLYDDAIAPGDWRFTHNDYGKPAISAQQNTYSLYFNLSHSSQRAVLAVSRFQDIGIDLEFAKKPRRVAAIAQRYFSAGETAEILKLPEALRQQRFYDLWTLKEAYIKACGMGLAIPLQDFTYRFEGDQGVAIEFDARREDNPSEWQLWQLDAGPDYKLALAARTGFAEPLLNISSRSLRAIDSFEDAELPVLRCS